MENHEMLVWINLLKFTHFRFYSNPTEFRERMYDPSTKVSFAFD